jgi:cobalt/nickel transport system permease protein
MHMADALVSPAVGGTMWAVSCGLIAHCVRKVEASAKERLVPMMGVLGAFVFTAQMINFTIPGTGSSGHLGGGLLLAALLGPHAAFLVIASVLAVQAFFFADGGLLALGCNIFNLGFWPSFVAYPLIYRAMTEKRGGDAPRSQARAVAAAVVAAVAGLQLGALGVVFETLASGLSELPFRAFALLMLPIHLAIGLVEGLTTAAVVAFVTRARPELSFAAPAEAATANGAVKLRRVLIGLLAVATLTGGVLSWFASSHPDGLEWSIAKATGQEEVDGRGGALHDRLAAVQEATAVLPDYDFRKKSQAERHAADEPDGAEALPLGTSVSGLAGGAATLALVCLIGLALKKRPRTA